jgi:hypothetical protein
MATRTNLRTRDLFLPACGSRNHAALRDVSLFPPIPTGAASFLTRFTWANSRLKLHSSARHCHGLPSSLLNPKMPRGTSETARFEWRLAPKHFRSRLTTNRPSGARDATPVRMPVIMTESIHGRTGGSTESTEARNPPSEGGSADSNPSLRIDLSLRRQLIKGRPHHHSRHCGIRPPFRGYSAVQQQFQNPLQPAKRSSDVPRDPGEGH